MIVADELLVVREREHGLLETADQQHPLEHAPGEIDGQRHDITSTV
jgi:hypothetical protein